MPDQSNIDKKARIFALFGDPTRLKILSLLAGEKEVKVSEIADFVGMSVACISHHLQMLKDNEVVQTRRDGNSIYYQLSNNQLINNIKKLI